MYKASIVLLALAAVASATPYLGAMGGQQQQQQQQQQAGLGGAGYGVPVGYGYPVGKLLNL